MQLTLSLPDELAIAINQIANSEKFICDALQAAIQKEQLNNPPKSKWRSIVERIELRDFDLGDYTENFNSDRESFRESFNFGNKTE
ncbi:MAG: hypothetical protein WCS87_00640 [Methylococcaceae bacterium]